MSSGFQRHPFPPFPLFLYSPNIKSKNVSFWNTLELLQLEDSQNRDTEKDLETGDSLLEKIQMKKFVRSETQNFTNYVYCHNIKQITQTWHYVFSTAGAFLFKAETKTINLFSNV